MICWKKTDKATPTGREEKNDFPMRWTFVIVIQSNKQFH